MTVNELIEALKANVAKYEKMIEAGASDADRLQRVVNGYLNDIAELEGR